MDVIRGTPVSERLVDLDVLAQYVGNDRLLQRRISQRFLQSTRQAVIELQQAVERDDFAHIGGLAHRIKPSAMAMGAGILCELATDLEKASREKCAVTIREQLRKLTPLMMQLEGEIAAL